MKDKQNLEHLSSDTNLFQKIIFAVEFLILLATVPFLNGFHRLETRPRKKKIQLSKLKNLAVRKIYFGKFIRQADIFSNDADVVYQCLSE